MKSGDESTSSQTQQPSIPVRPTKSNSSTSSGSSETVTKLKPPPPKPKKLSSKIAAFQQQLFNPMKSGSSADEDENKGEGEQPKPRKAVDSSKFLLRFGGNAIPLPGMFNPGQIPMHARPSSTTKDDDNDDDKEEQGSSRSVENAPVRRTRGPRGKKLPKAVSEAKVESESKFCLESGELFGLVFTKKVEESVDGLNEEEVAHKSLEEEVTEVNVKPEVALKTVEKQEEEDDIIDEYEKDDDIVEKDEPKSENGVAKEEVIEAKIDESVTVPGEFEEDTKEEEEEEKEEEPVHRIAVSTDSRESPIEEEEDDDDIVIDKTGEEKLNSSNSSLVDVKQEMEDELSKNDEML